MHSTIPDPETLVRRAETRWAAVAAAQPDLIPAIAVQRPMVVRTIRLVDRLRLEPPVLRLAPQRIADKLEAGAPLIRGEAAALPAALLAPLVLEACDDLAAGGAGDVARRVRGCIDDGRIDVESLLTASFDRNQDAIRTKALHKGISPDVLWLAAELAAGPAAHVAARALLDAQRPAISVNGNVAALCPAQTVRLARALGARIEVNVFYGPAARRARIAAHLRRFGAGRVYGAGARRHRVPGLAGPRGAADSAVHEADAVLVSLEDGDRTEALVRAGKKVVAIDLNPFSRTARGASITIVDNVVRALPLLAEYAGGQPAPARFDNRKCLRECAKMARAGA